MKKFLLSLALISLLVLPPIALAQAPETLKEIDVMAALDRITNWLFAILLVVAVIYIILAAFDFVTAGGNPDKVATARQNVMYALVGVTVAFLAKGLVALVRMVVGG